MKVYEKTKSRSWEVILSERRYIVEHFENLETDYEIWEVFDHKQRKIQNAEIENEVLKVLKLRIND
jgi:hypothetical protein